MATRRTRTRGQGGTGAGKARGRKAKDRERDVASAAPRSPANAEHSLALRTAFWQHIVRDMLTTMSVLQASRPDMFDGRMAVLTNAGERVAIAGIEPLFACGIPGTPADQALSIAVESSVFRIRTPEGEVFTLPLSEIRALHALSDDLVKSLEASSAQADGGDVPFGFAAYTSLATSPRAAPAPARRQRRTRKS